MDNVSWRIRNARVESRSLSHLISHWLRCTRVRACVCAFEASGKNVLFLFSLCFFLKNRVATRGVLLSFPTSRRVYLTNAKVAKTGQKLISSRYHATFQTRRHPPKEHNVVPTGSRRKKYGLSEHAEYSATRHSQTRNTPSPQPPPSRIVAPSVVLEDVFNQGTIIPRRAIEVLSDHPAVSSCATRHAARFVPLPLSYHTCPYSNNDRNNFRHPLGDGRRNARTTSVRGLAGEV